MKEGRNRDLRKEGRMRDLRKKEDRELSCRELEEAHRSKETFLPWWKEGIRPDGEGERDRERQSLCKRDVPYLCKLKRDIIYRTCAKETSYLCHDSLIMVIWGGYD